MAQYNLTCAAEMVSPLLAGRVIQYDRKPRFRRAVKPFFYGFPFGKQIAQADERKVMRQRRAKKRRAPCRPQ